jgi:RimJ/RimL family protein N-acetyltransferase
MSQSFNITLTTGRLTLRTPTWDDLPFILALWRDPVTMQPLGGPIELTAEQAHQWFTRMVDPGRPTDCYCLITNEANRPVGEISFHRLNPATMTADFNVKILAGERGQGYARQAIPLFLDYFFNQFGGRLLTDDLAPTNHTGQRVLMSLGFQHDPAKPADVFHLYMTRDQFNGLYKEQP